MENSRLVGIDSLRAWLVACGAFVGCFVVFGFLYAFGAFLRPIALAFGVSHAVTSALFSFMSLFSYVLTPLTGDIADHVGPRKVMFAGALLFAVALLATAHAASFPIAFLCLGGGMGAALACIYVPSIAAVGEWFKRSRDIALGFAISGIGAGTLVAAPFAAFLIGNYGWRTTLTLLAGAGGVLLLSSSLLIATPPVKIEGMRGGAAVWAKVRTPGFALIYSSRVLSGIPVFITMVYLPALASAEGVQHVSAAALVGYIGGASIVSRLGLNALAERFGSPLLYQFSCVSVSAACVIWMFAHSYPWLVVFAICLGMAYGGVASLTPAVAIHMFGLENIGELLGILLTSYGVAAALGPPIAGLLVDRSGHYRDVVWFALASSILGAISVLALSRYAPEAPLLGNSDEAAA